MNKQIDLTKYDLYFPQSKDTVVVEVVPEEYVSLRKGMCFAINKEDKEDIIVLTGGVELNEEKYNYALDLFKETDIHLFIQQTEKDLYTGAISACLFEEGEYDNYIIPMELYIPISRKKKKGPMMKLYPKKVKVLLRELIDRETGEVYNRKVILDERRAKAKAEKEAKAARLEEMRRQLELEAEEKQRELDRIKKEKKEKRRAEKQKDKKVETTPKEKVSVVEVQNIFNDLIN